LVSKISLSSIIQFLFAGILLTAHCSVSTGKIVVSHNTNNPPYKFVNDSAQADGILIEIWKLWSEKTGISVEFKNAEFEATVEMVGSGDADANAGLFPTSEREKYLDFSDPLLKLDYYLFADKTVYVPDFGKSDLEAFRIGVPEGYTRDFALKEFKGSPIAVFRDLPSLYEACYERKIKIFISPQDNLEYYIESTGSENRFYKIFDEPVYSMAYRGAVRKGNAELLKTINSGLVKISEEEKENIRTGWKEKIRSEFIFSRMRSIDLTDKELKWLTANIGLTVSGDPEWPPNSMYDESGNYVGIVADLWEIIEKKSGLNFKRVRSENWSRAVESIKNGEIKVLDCVSATPQRSLFMEFTEPVFTSNIILVGREELDYVNGLPDVKKLSVAVQEGVSEIELLKRDYPGMNIAFYSDIDMAYRDVSAGKVDLFLRHQSDFSYSKKEKMLTNLKIIGPTEYSREYRIGIAKGNPELVSILNKAINLITHEERNAIFDKWHGIEKSVIDYSLVWKITAAALFIMALFFYWNRTLSNEIYLRKRAQAELEGAMVKVKEATEAKSRFLANMSHEIRTPMNAILGFTDLLKKTPMTTVQENYLNTIKSGGVTLLNIINDILDISKIEANKLDINYSYFDLNSLVFDLKQFFDEKLRTKNLDFLIRYDERSPRIIFLDELRLRQIFFNLVSNAIKFTESGGITISVISSDRADGHIDLSIEVEDTGSGIKPEDTQRIFEAFEQASTHGESKMFQGTGLGLAITKRLTELMNGKISVVSEFGKGSRFIMAFSDVRYDSEAHLRLIPGRKDITSVIFQNAKILIADDIESNRMLLSEMCKSIGLDTIEADNGRSAIELAKLHVPDAILMDIRMPVMDGYEAISVIKNDNVLKRIPVIAVTASVMNSEAAMIDKNKFDGFIRKPVAMDELVLQLKNFLVHDIESEKEGGENITDDKIKNKPALILQLKERIMPEIEAAKLKHNFGHIKQTAAEMKNLASEHNSKKLLHFSEGLYRSVVKYDIEDIKVYLTNFNDLISNIENNAGEA
jgi:two-component system, NarL family, sensor histidine kinase EvgS